MYWLYAITTRGPWKLGTYEGTREAAERVAHARSVEVSDAGYYVFDLLVNDRDHTQFVRAS